MIRTVEAVIDEDGNVRLLEPIHPPTARRTLVTILEEVSCDAGERKCAPQRGGARAGLEPARGGRSVVAHPAGAVVLLRAGR